MTTLDCSKYFENLKKLNFSDSLLEKEKQSFQDCIDNLSKVKYSEFETKFDDLDDYESTNCDFFNYYRWIGGMEPIGGIKIKNIQFYNYQKAIVVLEYFNYYTEDNKYYFYGKNKVTLIKVDNQWKILAIDWK